MSKQEDQRNNNFRNITLTDIKLAKVYYSILVDIAKHKHCLTYGELVERAKEENPDINEVQNALAVSAGRRLDVVRMFTVSKSLPDLTSLIISKSTGEVGSGFPIQFKASELRKTVFSFTWSDQTPAFDLFIVESEKQIIPRKKRNPAEARDLMAKHYQLNKDAYPASVKDKRELLIELLQEGFDVDDAFKEALAS